MSRPDWCPQDVWDAANVKCDLTAASSLRIAIAGAIMAEREACAALADAQAIEPDPDEQDPYDDYEMGCRGTARRLADTIRNRSN